MSAVAQRKPAVTAERLALAARVRELRDGGLLQREIQAELGISRSYASELLVDPDGTKSRARKDSYRGICRICGGATSGSEGPAMVAEVCIDCSSALQHETRYWTAEAIVARFQAFHVHTGRLPTATESMCSHGAHKIRAKLSPARLAEIDDVPAALRLPHTAVVYRELGSWPAALRAAGLTSSPTGGAGHRERSRTMRTFVVLEKNGVGFKPRAIVEAPSSAAAIQDVADGEGVFVAIPEQHWRERKVAAKTVFAVVEEPSRNVTSTNVESRAREPEAVPTRKGTGS